MMPRSRNQYVSEMRERFLDPARTVARARGSYDLVGGATGGPGQGVPMSESATAPEKEDKNCTSSSTVSSTDSVPGAGSLSKKGTNKIKDESKGETKKEKEEEEEATDKIRAHIDPEVGVNGSGLWTVSFLEYPCVSHPFVYPHR